MQKNSNFGVQTPAPPPHSLLVATTTRAMKETCDFFIDTVLRWKVEFDDHLQQDAFQIAIANPCTLLGSIHYANGWKFLQRLIWCEESRLGRNEVCSTSSNFLSCTSDCLFGGTSPKYLRTNNQ